MRTYLNPNDFKSEVKTIAKFVVLISVAAAVCLVFIRNADTMREETEVMFSSVSHTELLHFNARLQNNTVRLKWVTGRELNNHDFMVEYSTDGNKFAPLSTIMAAGTSDVPRKYMYLHKRPPEGNVYYRLKLTYRDGRSRYFNPISINTQKPGAANAGLLQAKIGSLIK